MDLGTITGFLRLNTTDYLRGLRDAERQAQNSGSRISRITNDIGKDIVSSLKQAAGAFAVMKIADFFGDTIKSASDLQESTNKVAQVFKGASPVILQFAASAAKNIGISNVAARDAAATFGIFGQSAGLAGADLAQFSIKLVGLASDLASFYNTSPADAIRGIASALRGESEPIRAYGVLLNEITLRTEGVKLGLISTTKEALTPQQRVLAAYNVILQQTSFAQGDFQRTSHLLANSMRINSATFEDTKAAIGEALLPVATQFFGIVTTVGLPALQGLGTAISGVFTVLGPIIAILGDLIGIASNLPGPILAGAAALAAWILLKGPIILFFDSIFVGATRVAFSFAAMQAAVIASSGVLSGAVVVLKTVGAALLSAFGGPIGLAIVALTVGLGFVFSALSNNKSAAEDAAAASQAHQEAVDNIATSLDSETGALTRATRAQIIDKLEKQGALKALQDLGISTEGYVDAILGVGDAAPKMTSQLKAQAQAALESSSAYKELAPRLEEAGISQEQFLQAIAAGDLSQISDQLTNYAGSARQAGVGAGEAAIGAQAMVDTNLEGTLAGLTAAAGPAAGLLQTLGATTGETADALDSGARKAQAMGDGALDASGNLKDMGDNTTAAGQSLGPFADALKETEDNAKGVGEAADYLTQKLDELRGGTANAAEMQRNIDSAFRDVGESARDLAAAHDGITEADLKVIEAQHALEEATNNLGKAQDDGGTTAEDVTQAQLDLSAAQRDQSGAAGELAAATDKEAEAHQKAGAAANEAAGQAYKTTLATGSLEEAVHAASAAMQVQRDRFIASQSAADQESGAAAKLADQLGLIPNDIETAYKAPGSEYARAQASGLDTDVRNIPDNKNVNISTNARSVVGDINSISLSLQNLSDKTVTVYERRVSTGPALVAWTGGKVGRVMHIPGYDAGGKIPGTPPSNPRLDNMWAVGPGKRLLRVRSNEWIQPEPAVNYYGDRFMYDVQHKLFPKPRGYAEGGQVNVAASQPIFRGPSTPTISITPSSGQQTSTQEQKFVLEIRGGDRVLMDILEKAATAAVDANQQDQARRIQFRR